MKQNNWQPIETAPVETDILVFGTGHSEGLGTVCYSRQDRLLNSDMGIGNLCWADRSCTFKCAKSWYDVDEDGYPTHWMPLPKPPEEKP